ncbi:MAG TPA: serine protease [Aromatoleum sp.]|uniref:S1 family peptidase n=1 Tax=Aromatoleum sp. TaxID=2307007 RepID=UPI002B48A722|nr:serine protease [Aromatoleum sp.]HJV26001.1 serine protease [Aromatoleum sp.]
MIHRLREVLHFVAICVPCLTSGTQPSAAGEQFDTAVRSVVAVRFEHAPGDFSEGMGVYVGDGRIFTVAHVLGSVKPLTPVTVLTTNDSGYYGTKIDAVVEKVHPKIDAAVLRVAEPRGLLPLPPCRSARSGDRVSLARLSEVEPEPGNALGGTFYVLEIEDRAFVALPGIEHPVILGRVEQGFSGTPVLSMEGECFYGIVTGSLVMTSQTKDRVRRFERVMLLDPAVLSDF